MTKPKKNTHKESTPKEKEKDEPKHAHKAEVQTPADPLAELSGVERAAAVQKANNLKIHGAPETKTQSVNEETKGSNDNGKEN